MPLLSFDCTEKYEKKIRKGIEDGYWATISEALRELVKIGFKHGNFDFLQEKNDEEKEKNDS